MILTVSQGEVLTSTYVLATLSEDDTLPPTTSGPPAAVPSQISQPAPAASFSVPSSVPSGPSSSSAGLLHSTRRETSDVTFMEVSQDVSTIPHLQPDIEEAAEEIAGSPPAKKKKFLFRSRVLTVRHNPEILNTFHCRRCFNATVYPNKDQPVLAPDSDEEN